MRAVLDMLEHLNRGTFADPAIVWLHDTTTTAFPEEFQGRLDLSRLTAMGHSFGGVTAIYTGSLDERIHSIVALDPWMFPLPKEKPVVKSRYVPVLAILAENFQWPENQQACHEMVRLLGGGDRIAEPAAIGNDDDDGVTCGHLTSQVITLLATDHISFSDFPIVFPAYLLSLFRRRSSSPHATVIRRSNELIRKFLTTNINN